MGINIHRESYCSLLKEAGVGFTLGLNFKHKHVFKKKEVYSENCEFLAEEPGKICS